MYCCVPCSLKQVPTCSPSGCETQDSMSYFKGDARLNPNLQCRWHLCAPQSLRPVGSAGTVAISGLRAKGCYGNHIPCLGKGSTQAVAHTWRSGNLGAVSSLPSAGIRLRSVSFAAAPLLTEPSHPPPACFFKR